jgi:tetratricopeptide (TPR) repeat protein
LVNKIHAGTEGNPFFVEELFRHLEEENRLFDSAGRFCSDLEVGDLEAPPGVRLVVARRVERLRDSTQKTLAIAAVIGRFFSLDLLDASGAFEPGSSLESIEEAEKAGLILPVADSPKPGYEFSHELIRQAVIGSVSAARRQRLHLEVANAIERIYSINPESPYAETLDDYVADLAHHYSQGGDREKAIQYLQLAAQQAAQRSANPEAADYVTRGLALLEKLMQEPGRDHLKREDEQRQFSILISLAEAQRKLGAHLEAQATLIRAIKLAQLLRSAELLVQAARELARLANWHGVAAEPAVGFLEDALRIAQPGDFALRIKILAALGRALAAAGQRKAATEAAREAVALARTFGDTDLLSEALEGTLLAFQGPETIEQRFAYANELMQLWRANERKVANHDHTFTLASWALCSCYLELGDMHAFDAELDAWIRYEEKWQDPFKTTTGLGYRAMRALMLGDFAASERLAEEASALGQRLQTQNSSGIFALQMFTLRREQGRLKELEPVVRYFIQQGGAAAAWRPGLALIYAELGFAPEAREQFEILAQRNFADVPRDGLWMASMTYLTDICNFLGDDRRAAMLYDLLAPFEGRNVVVGNMTACYGALSRYLGALATTLRRWDEAERHFEDALAMNAPTEAPPWLAHTQHQYAAMLLMRNRPGDRERAVEMFEAALAAARGLGMNELAERVGAALAAASRQLS